MSEISKTSSTRRYKSVTIASLGNRRRGKHHDLTGGILRELKMLKEGSALEIPLASVGDLDLANLRSAVHRAATADKLLIETQSDEENFYVWVQKKS
jgi:hypothetical protein